MTETHEAVRDAIAKAYKAFVDAVINDLHVNFHPDTDFREYIQESDIGFLPAFEREDAVRLELINRQFNKALDDGKSPDVYEIGLPILNKAIAEARRE